MEKYSKVINMPNLFTIIVNEAEQDECAMQSVSFVFLLCATSLLLLSQSEIIFTSDRVFLTN